MKKKYKNEDPINVRECLNQIATENEEKLQKEIHKEFIKNVLPQLKEYAKKIKYFLDYTIDSNKPFRIENNILNLPNDMYVDYMGSIGLDIDTRQQWVGWGDVDDYNFP